jgi:hypothetical protein
VPSGSSAILRKEFIDPGGPSRKKDQAALSSALFAVTFCRKPNSPLIVGDANPNVSEISWLLPYRFLRKHHPDLLYYSHSSFLIPHSLFIIHHSSFIIHHSSFIIHYSLLS